MRRREAQRSVAHRLLDHRAPCCLISSSVGLALMRLVAEDPSPDRGVPDVHPEIEPEASAPAGEELAESRETPVDVVQRRDLHALDPGEDLRQVGMVVRAAGRDAEAAIAGRHRRDAVQRGGVAQRIPGDLRVVMRVGIDDSRCDDEAVGVERLVGRFTGQPADGRDDAVGDRHVGRPSGNPGAVDDETAADQEVMHGGSGGASRFPARRSARSRRRTGRRVRRSGRRPRGPSRRRPR